MEAKNLEIVKIHNPLYISNFSSLFMFLFLLISINLTQLTRGKISSCKKPGQIALTFDDGPTDNTAKLLEILLKTSTKVTFFVLGKQIETSKFRDLLIQADKQGHDIGSHTYTHPRLSSLPRESIVLELNRTRDIILAAISKSVRFMRNPYFDSSEPEITVVNELGYESIFANLDTRDFQVHTTNPQDIYTNFEKIIQLSDPTKDSFVVLLHDTYKETLDNIDRIVDFSRKKGYQLVTVHECRGYSSAYYEDDILTVKNSILRDNKTMNMTKNPIEIVSDSEIVRMHLMSIIWLLLV